jgi:nitrate/TMAO reductase-like tetraheme cytochrome c subunit
MPQNDTNEGHGCCRNLWRRPRLWFLLGIPLGGFLMFLAGIIFWGGFNTFMEATNSLWFCTSCHEMDTVYNEYKTSVHYQNQSGVRAICSDCHVPKEWVPKIVAKTRATFNELPKKIIGTIDTPEKFKAKRLELAEHVWAKMKETDSRECRNCHALESMELDKQDKSAQKKHSLQRKLEKGETCIDCHKGIAHELPEGYEG